MDTLEEVLNCVWVYVVLSHLKRALNHLIFMKWSANAVRRKSSVVTSPFTHENAVCHESLKCFKQVSVAFIVYLLFICCFLLGWRQSATRSNVVLNSYAPVTFIFFILGALQYSLRWSYAYKVNFSNEYIVKWIQ